MRRLAWVLLLAFVFTLPWEYSFDIGEPWGNIARVAGAVLLGVTGLAMLQARRMRTPGPLQLAALALVVWFAASVLWSADAEASVSQVRGFFQQIMVVWIAWELAESPGDLRALLWAYTGGAWVLALLTWRTLFSAVAEGQARFVPEGQDPNDVARYLLLAMPMAALLWSVERRRAFRWLALAYLPAAVFAVVLTASRGGFLALVPVIMACGALVLRRARGTAWAALAAGPVVMAASWFAIPRETLWRLASIPDELLGGGLNQRWNIWAAGWDAFARAPWIGWGAGMFVSATGLAPINTAHNTALALATEGGLVAVALMLAMVVMCAGWIVRLPGRMRAALGTAFAAWLFLSLVSNVQGNRTTWFLLGLISVAGRMVRDERAWLEEEFADDADDELRSLMAEAEA